MLSLIPVSLNRFKNGFLFFILLTAGSLSLPVFFSSAWAEEAPALNIRELYEAGTKALQNGDARKALEYFNRVKTINPDIPQLYNLIGMTHLELKESAHDAIAAFEEAIRLDPKMSEAYNHLGVIYSTIVEDLDLAEEYFASAIEIDPSFARAHFGLGWLYLVRRKDGVNGREHLEKAVELNPNFLEAQYYLGVSYILTGNKPQALKPITVLQTLPGGEDYANTLQVMMNQDAELIKEKMFS